MKTNIVRCAGMVFLTILTPAAVAATFTVTNVNDNGAGSFRDAINQANGDPVAPVIISFNIPAGLLTPPVAGGVAVIRPLSPLPVIRNIHGHGITIDGYSQPGSSYAPMTPSSLVVKVELDGGLIPTPHTPPPPPAPQFAHGLYLMSSSNRVQGLCIHSFPHDGISIQGIPKSAAGPSEASSNQIYWNLVGTDVTGMNPMPNGHDAGGLWGGIYVKVLPGSPGIARQNHILENVVSGNNIEGVGISNCPEKDSDVLQNHVERCYIGIDITGTGPLGNGHDGVYIGEGAHDNVIDQNWIGANGYDGVGIVGYGPSGLSTYGNLLIHNKIGVDANHNPMGNRYHGVAIGSYGPGVWGFAPSNKLDTNIIAWNGLTGVTVREDPSVTGDQDTSFNTITANSIYQNGLVDPGHLGIDLAFEPGVTPNDPGDADAGANGLVNFPLITSAIHSSGATTVSGTIDTPGLPAVIEVFTAAPGADGSGHGQGAVMAGGTTAAGPSWTVVLSSGGQPGQLLTATATDAAGNTSEFSLNFPVWDDNQQDVDFGDAPDGPYPTLKINGGPGHQIMPGMYLGMSVDGEADGQPDPSATGDDNDGNDDGDGVVFPLPLVPGQQAQINVVASMMGRLDAWIDFDGNGVWSPAVEQILASAVHPGGGMMISYSFTVPPTAVAGNTFARIRYSSGGGLMPMGSIAPDGEVEDHMVTIQNGEPQEPRDWGDAPDQPYPTLAANNGANHTIVQGIHLGSRVDGETDGQPHPYAAGDDNAVPPGTDDEDGVVFLSPIVIGGTASLQVTASVPGVLYGWVDFNRNGTWEPGEQVYNALSLTAGVNNLSFPVPAGAVPGTTFARFRFTTAAGPGLGFTGPAPDGEVEDYILEIEDGGIDHKMHWAQLPDPNGWDVRGYAPKILADDFRCTESGPITRITFWGSWNEDIIGQIHNVHLSIHDDDRTGEFSKPGKLLWDADTAGGLMKFMIDPDPESGDQGWFDPNTGQWIRPDHRLYFKYTVDIPEEIAFVQERGSIYWLDIQVQCEDGKWGWKTSRSAHFEDDAVWDDTPQEPEEWRELTDPETNLSLDLAFVIGGSGPDEPQDWGDAPDPSYPALMANNGARHVIVTGYHMGGSIDPEPDGQPTPNASGDDSDGNNDDDGVYFYPLIIGRQSAIDVSVTGNGMIDAWIDFNGNGSWLDAGEQIASSAPVVPGLNQIVFNVPTGMPVAPTFARIRFSSGGGLPPTGGASDGEVEDYEVKIQPEEELAYDFGDAPDMPYPALAASNGARHLLGGPLWLGSTVDAEPDGQPSPMADGDDLNLIHPGGPDDEDGVIFGYAMISNHSNLMQVTASAHGLIDVWIDWNGNGSWADPGDNILSAYAVNPGVNFILITVPQLSYTGPTKARVRISSNGYLPPTGFARDGEVEDYDLFLHEEGGMDFGDAPNMSIGASTNYPTSIKDFGAAHFIDSLFLGILIDAEFDGQPTISATGDDLAGLADEDGLTFNTPWISGVNARFDVMVNPAAVGPAFDLDLWVDWDGDGTWAQANEHVLAAHPVMQGVNPLSIPVPAGLGPVWTYARFRLTYPGTGTGYTGYVFGGEVEDYMMPIGMRVRSAISIDRTVTPNNAVLTWAAAAGASTYSVYSTTNLQPTFPDPPNWTLETTTSSLTWSDPVTTSRKFYVVVAFP